ncbi:EAL domain-containing protein [Aquincola tertiaricarbonis]|uniref:EAL domain-containing protein n=1 Tax=Aquincola tertiaricarbonis TaxID=391953 RepID=A0ABY4S5G9_AQUTE|nr:EAL domain-containing protein [Aquincola tertiaricarbonis]URI07930.1 EAL domain-containing protein [Aquincola tertiaricarbonis]
MPQRDAALTMLEAGALSAGPERALREVLDRLGPSVFAGLLDADGVLRYANQAALQAIGAAPEEVLGQRFETTPWWQACELSQRRLQQALARASRGEASRFDVRVATRRGTTLSMDFSLLPLYGPDGRIAWLIPSACDVSDRERAQRQLRLTRHAVEQANDALFQVGPDGAFRDANAAACRLLGLTREQLLRLRVPDIDTQVDDTQWPQRWREMCERGSLRFETSLRHHQGHEIPVDVSVSLVTSDGETFAHVCVDDLRDRRAAEQRIQRLLQFDELTGLPNRQRLFELLAATLQTGAETAVLVLELDRFKRINDGLGLHIGDAVLREVAQRIATPLRSTDLVARRGGDEFVVVMPSPSGAAMDVAQALLDTVARPITIGSHEIHLTCSVGIARSPADGDRAETLLRHANAALEQAKRLGRNQVSVYTRAPHDDDPQRLALETALRQASRDEQLELHYQPQVDLVQGRIVGVEALLRWQHPTLGHVAPDRFIPIAEETGLIVPIGDWVLRRAVEQAAAWQRAGLPPLRMAVNLSARQLLQQDLARRIEGLLAASGLDPRRFGVEVTESMLITNFDQAVQHLRALRALGVEVSLDDFGTGYSSLSYLRRLPVDVVKIDRSLVPDVTAPAEDVSITRAIITMAHQLQMKVLAEGVESEGQAALLAANQCDQMQGWWFSAAQSAAAVETMLREGRRVDPALLGRRSRERTLLLVDDEENIVAALRRLLRAEGWRLLSATSAEQALELMARHEVDVILSDQRMPGLTGVELLRRARQLYRETIRLVLSGYTELQSITDAINEGAIYKFLAKPWDDEQLRSHLREAFGLKEMADQNRRLDREVQAANRELAELNRRLQTLLSAQREQNEREVGSREAAQELLDAVPVPVFGIDDQGLLVFANAPAQALFGLDGSLLGGPADEHLPQSLRPALDGEPLMQMHAGRRWWAMSRPLSGSARGRLLVLLPQAGASK